VVNPDTVIEPEPEVDVVPVIPPGVLTAVKLVALLPELGAVYVTDAVVLPVAVAVPMVGARGAEDGALPLMANIWLYPGDTCSQLVDAPICLGLE
jgi:hypothetical protein